MSPMDSTAFTESRFGRIKKYLIPLGLGVAGFVFIAYGLLSTFLSKPSPQVKFQPSEQIEKRSPIASNDSSVSVDVEGAVQNPGVYPVSSSGRIKDALVVAGGLSEEADKNWVSKNINLAIKVRDGMKIYIPKQGEQVSGLSVSTDTSAAGTSMIGINSASESQLDTLSGVGLVTAQKIIANRPYQSIDELLLKKVVSKSVFEKIREKITTD